MAGAAMSCFLPLLCLPQHKATVRSLVLEIVLAYSLFSPFLWALVKLLHNKESTWLTNDEQNFAVMPPITAEVIPVSPSVLLNLAQNDSPEPMKLQLQLM